jgi:transcription elongation factor GreA
MSDIDIRKKEIKEELEKLKHEFKVELPKIIAHARAYGDLKENAEYHAARERQSFVRARINLVMQQLAEVTSIKVDDLPQDKIAYGSKITLLDIDSGDRVKFTIVSPEDVAPSKGKISLNSPIGMALKNQGAGAKIQFVIPAGTRNYFIEKLETIHGNEFEAEYVE